MKPIINVVAILLIVFGVFVLGYAGFTYTTQEKVAQVGNLQVTSENKKTVYFHPMTGALSLVAGVILIILNKRNT